MCQRSAQRATQRPLATQVHRAHGKPSEFDSFPMQIHIVAAVCALPLCRIQCVSALRTTLTWLRMANWPPTIRLRGFGRLPALGATYFITCGRGNCFDSCLSLWVVTRSNLATLTCARCNSFVSLSLLWVVTRSNLSPVRHLAQGTLFTTTIAKEIRQRNALRLRHQCKGLDQGAGSVRVTGRPLLSQND